MTSWGEKKNSRGAENKIPKPKNGKKVEGEIVEIPGEPGCERKQTEVDSEISDHEPRNPGGGQMGREKPAEMGCRGQKVFRIGRGLREGEGKNCPNPEKEFFRRGFQEKKEIVEGRTKHHKKRAWEEEKTQGLGRSALRAKSKTNTSNSKV